MNQARDLFDLIVVPKFEKAQPRWIELARITARFLCHRDGSTTIDAVRAECPPPAGSDPRINGAVFRRGEFEKIGYENSSRSTCHGRPVGIFKLRDHQTGGLA